MRSLFLAVGLMLAISQVAAADDNQTTVDVEAGNWLAQSGTDDYGKHMCSALGGEGGYVVGFKASEGDGLSLRIVNKSWSLPADAAGKATLTVGKENFSFDMVGGTSDMLVSNLKDEDLKPLLDAMDKGSSVAIKVGESRSFSVSLSGSTRVVNSFRTCSTNHGFADLGAVVIPGANPFGSETR